MTREQMQIARLHNLLKAALNAESEEQYEYWKTHFERYLNKLYHQKIKYNANNERNMDASGSK